MEELKKVMYLSNEYQYYCKEQYKPYYDFLKDIEDNIDCIKDNELFYVFKNWMYYNKVYKTISINHIHLRLNDDLYKNVLYCLQIRDQTRYDINVSNTSLHLYYDNRCDIMNTKELEKVSKLKSCFNNIYIHLYNNQYFIDELYEYCNQNNFELVYELESKNDIADNKSSVHLFLTDDNLNDIEDIITKCINNKNIHKLYITSALHKRESRSIYRSKLDNLIGTYNTKDFSIIPDDYTIGQHIGMTNNQEIYLKEGNMDIIFEDNNIDDVVSNMKKYLIEKIYIDKKCLYCDETVMCMLGISDKPCEVKIC